ncbi:hypothetical protein FD754_002767 [Muntiacus muntjak]|uniref:Uncharacterized protein n=1 Tax=Muntiacus muntjak TaxID=9888 RepID=A0A5N3WA89_MUNMU|nr:hypothetical protein FD754_002767 [Muntiacus muntjak]
MGFFPSKSATRVSALCMDSKVGNHLMQRTEKSKLEQVTQSKDTGTGYLSEKPLGPVMCVKESDGK